MNFHKAILLLLFFSISIVKSQYVLRYNDDVVLDNIYIFNGSDKAKIQMPFPGYNVISEKNYGYDIRKAMNVNVFHNTISIPVNLNDIKIKYPISTFILQYKTYNIKQLDINIIRLADTVKITNLKNLVDGYQFPVEATFKSSDNIQKIEYTVHKLDMERPFEFYVGRMNVSYYKDYNDVSPFSPNYDGKVSVSSPSTFGIYNIYNNYPKAYHQNMVLSNANIEYSTDYKEALILLVGDNIKKYPFYEERKINKKKTTVLYEKLTRHLSLKNVDGCSIITEINSFLANNFNDPHFKITSRCKVNQKLLGPLRIQLIDNKFLVSANLDTSLLQTIPLNSELISVGDQKLNDFKRNSRKFLTDLMVEKINSLLTGKEGEEISIKIKVGQKLKAVSYTVKNGYSIPENFKPKQGMFKLIDSVSYFKINLFTREIPTLFVNHLDEINSSKSLIIDLRGNGGGEGNEAARLLSYIVNRNFVHTNILNRSNGVVDILEVGTKNGLFFIHKNKKIVLLIDHITACAAELFANSLKRNRENVIIVGRENSAGSITPTYNIMFDDINKTTLITGSYAPFKYLIDRPIQSVGLNPDVKVKIREVADLQPYNDKVLLEAIKLIK